MKLRLSSTNINIFIKIVHQENDSYTDGKFIREFPKKSRIVVVYLGILLRSSARKKCENLSISVKVTTKTQWHLFMWTRCTFIHSVYIILTDFLGIVYRGRTR